MSAPLTVRAAGVSRVYDEEYALIDVDAEFTPGHVTALLGPNGAGKSTLMGLLSTLLRPSEGVIYFGETPAERLDAAARARIGYVGHKTMLYGPLTARENLQFFGQLYGQRDPTRVTSLLARVGLEGDADRPAAGFSRGMAQRLTLARALLPRPDLLLLDEPLTGLDREGVALALDMIRQAALEGAAVVLVSHDLSATATIADRVLILKRGRRRFEGAVQGDLVARYHQEVDG
ncbi:ABC transporter ATP-binding protein [Myxococcota bacterium]|nr:ABC transporter ATP-binding protein [Myxococcota bacterium]MBU1432841.1 ABC transporter ATP-binding protein [Myxococcota bacterium]MBU1897525.1 ABC transporter ATP-binding protein [Myxococcota bacterium]